MPSMRSRFVASRSLRRRGPPFGSAVNWWMTCVGRAASTAAMSASRSNASATATEAPSFRRSSLLLVERVNAVTGCPAATRARTSGIPMAPEPPATKTFMMHSFPG